MGSSFFAKFTIPFMHIIHTFIYMKGDKNMTQAQKLAKKGRTMRIAGIIGEIVLPLPFVWGMMIKRGAEIETTSKVFNLEDLAKLLVDSFKDNPDLAKEYAEELEACLGNPDLMKDIINSVIGKTEGSKEEPHKDEGST